MMSAALRSKSGSLRLCSARADVASDRPRAKHGGRDSLLTPRCLASLRQDQCVEPSAGLRRVASRILARSRGVSLDGGWPGRCVSSPSRPWSRKRFFQREMVGAVVSSFSLMAS